MAQRRMFSLKVIDTDSFLEMSPSAQNLYFHLGMRADDDGFVASPKKIMKVVSAPEDDMKVLIAKGFIVPMSTNGICVISHWKINNLIKSDRYTETIYIEEKARLIEENGIYKVDIMGSKMVPLMEPQVRLGKDSKGKVRIVNPSETSSEEKDLNKKIGEIIKAFELINPASKSFYSRKPQRDACRTLIENYGFDTVLKLISEVIPKTNARPYYPTITTPIQLNEKWASLYSAVNKDFSKNSSETML